MDEEVLEYITLCVMFTHKYDQSPKITKEATQHEEIIFVRAIKWLRQFDTNNKVFSKE